MIASQTCSGVIRERFRVDAMWRRSRKRRFSVGVCSCTNIGLISSRIPLPVPKSEIIFGRLLHCGPQHQSLTITLCVPHAKEDKYRASRPLRVAAD